MQRKVIRQGNGTLTITLPKNWCDKFNIREKEYLEVKERENELVVGSEKEIDLGRVVIDVTGLDRSSIMYYIRSVYRRGFDEIIVKFNNPLAFHYRTGKNKKVTSVIHREVNRLVGVEVMDQKNNSCTIKDISADSFKDFDIILRKVFLLINDSLNDLLIGAKELNNVLLYGIEEKHDTITKFVSYCLRLLNKQGYARKACLLYNIIECLDMITDIIKYSARDLSSYKKRLNKETLIIMSSVRDSFHLFYELFYKFDLKKFAELNKIRDGVLRRIELSFKKIPEKELILAKDSEHILEIIREISGARMGLEY